MEFKKGEIEILEEIIDKFSARRQTSRKRIILMDYKEFLSCLNKEQRKLIKEIQNLDLKKYGKKAPWLGIIPPPKDLVIIRGQKYRVKSEIHQALLQLLPKEVYQAFKKMNQAIKKDLKRPLLVMSGYRSPAYQMILFLNFLKENNWQMKKTLKRVTLPGYSEHGYPLRQAIDFGTIKQTEDPEDFVKTKEYKWLKKNASKFGFYLSFPRNNKVGVTFEPWHWHYEISRAEKY
jgi:LAS superfamily LD-carboxypeptidase LdcB